MEFAISDFKLNDKEEDNPAPKHEGLFYRATVSDYYSQATGTFHHKKQLKLLKRESCKGCPTCDYINEIMLDEIDGFLDKIKHGKKYELKIEGDRSWTDYGYEYDNWLELKVVE